MPDSHNSPNTCAECQRALTSQNAFAADEVLFCVRCAPHDAVPGWYQMALAEGGPKQFEHIRWPSFFERFRDQLQNPISLFPIIWRVAVVLYGFLKFAEGFR